MHGLLNFLKNILKLCMFRNFLKKFMKIFENCLKISNKLCFSSKRSKNNAWFVKFKKNVNSIIVEDDNKIQNTDQQKKTQIY